MAAVLGIVRGHSGGISVTSKPDEGTTLQVLLPGVEKIAENKSNF